VFSPVGWKIITALSVGGENKCGRILMENSTRRNISEDLNLQTTASQEQYGPPVALILNNFSHVATKFF
jgi:hypothetical protein